KNRAARRLHSPSPTYLRTAAHCAGLPACGGHRTVETCVQVVRIFYSEGGQRGLPCPAPNLPYPAGMVRRLCWRAMFRPEAGTTDMDALKQAVRTYGRHHANRDGLASTPVPGLRMMYVEEPAGDLHSVYRPLVCFVLQGAKRMMVGSEERVFCEGQSVIVGADMPVVGRIIEATQEAPYLAIAVDLEMALLR